MIARMSDISAPHPQFTAARPDWDLLRDAYRGERRVKSQGIKYLPMTTAQVLDKALQDNNSVGAVAYRAYMLRARFPNFVREAVQMAIGMMHSQEALIKLPEGMKNIRGIKGETLTEILRKVNTEQLITGRVGLMADIPSDASADNDMPVISIYKAESILNWDAGVSSEISPETLNLVVLNESGDVRQDGFSWVKKDKYRVLIIGKVEENEEFALYRQAVSEETDHTRLKYFTPSWKGQTLREIPFEIVNSCDVVAEVDDPPLLDLANACMAIYRGEADYRQSLHLQSQETFVTIGGNFQEGDAVRVGAGARIDLPLGGDAKYVGVQSTGLAEQRSALERLESRAGSMGAQTLDTTSRERESGDSLRIRVAARTADMNQIVDAGAFALERLLKKIARWIGENPEEISVKPNKEFGEMPLTGQTMVEIATARNLGFPITAKSMHELARKRRMTQMSYEEEVAAAEAESKDDFVFKKVEKADRSVDQPNAPGNRISGLKSSTE